jgi:hypothetical protein
MEILEAIKLSSEKTEKRQKIVSHQSNETIEDIEVKHYSETFKKAGNGLVELPRDLPRPDSKKLLQKISFSRLQNKFSENRVSKERHSSSPHV